MESTFPENIQAKDGKTLSPETLASIKRMASHGVSLDVIAKYHSASLDQLQQRYGAEIAQAYLDSNLQVLDALHRMAVSGRNPAATIFWINNHCTEILAASRAKKVVSSGNDKLTSSTPSSPDSPKSSRSSAFKPTSKLNRVVFRVYNNDGEPNAND